MNNPWPVSREIEKPKKHVVHVLTVNSRIGSRPVAAFTKKEKAEQRRNELEQKLREVMPPTVALSQLLSFEITELEIEK